MDMDGIKGLVTTNFCIALLIFLGHGRRVSKLILLKRFVFIHTGSIRAKLDDHAIVRLCKISNRSATRVLESILQKNELSSRLTQPNVHDHRDRVKEACGEIISQWA